MDIASNRRQTGASPAQFALSQNDFQKKGAGTDGSVGKLTPKVGEVRTQGEATAMKIDLGAITGQKSSD